jgi:carboxymethylenebutenolidase
MSSRLRRVTIPPVADERAMPAMLAEPSEPNGSGLLLIHDIIGMSEDMSRIAERFAEHGYVVVVPGFFGPGSWLPCVARAVATLRRGRGPQFDRLSAALDEARAHPDVRPERVGVVGFCLGGGFALLLAARDGAAAVAAFYGDVPRNLERLRGLPPCVAGYGGRDRMFGPQADRLDSYLREHGIEHDLTVYPHAGHAYANQHTGPVAWAAAHSPTRAGYDHAAAEDSWARMLSFFERHLVSGNSSRAVDGTPTAE